VKIYLQQWIDKPFEEYTKPPKNLVQGVFFEKDEFIW